MNFDFQISAFPKPTLRSYTARSIPDKKRYFNQSVSDINPFGISTIGVLVDNFVDMAASPPTTSITRHGRGEADGVFDKA